MFRVGQRVVLVEWAQADIVNGWMEIGAHYPNVGDVYTIRGILPWKDSAVLLLHEVNNSHLCFDPEPGFHQRFFRPVIERKTDISQFKAMLTPAGKKERANAS